MREQIVFYIDFNNSLWFICERWNRELNRRKIQLKVSTRHSQAVFIKIDCTVLGLHTDQPPALELRKEWTGQSVKGLISEKFHFFSCYWSLLLSNKWRVGPYFLPSKCLFNRRIRRNNLLFHFPTKIFILHHNLRHSLRLVDVKLFKIFNFFSNFSSWLRSLCFQSGHLWFPQPLIKKFTWPSQYLWAFQYIFLCFHRKFKI